MMLYLRKKLFLNISKYLPRELVYWCFMEVVGEALKDQPENALTLSCFDARNKWLSKERKKQCPIPTLTMIKN